MKNIIINNDALSFLKTLPSKSVDAIITSPPYDNMRSYKKLSFGEFEKIAIELVRVLKEGGVIVWVVSDETVNGSETGTSSLQASFFRATLGLKQHDTMLYEKNTSNFAASKNSKRYTQIFEYVYIFSKGKLKTANLICDKPNRWSGWTNWGKNRKRTGKNDSLVARPDIKEVPCYSPRNNIFRYNVGSGLGTRHKETYEHPASFPEKLVADHIITWTTKNDIVLDPFMGSGTTCMVAKEFGRQYIGIEIDTIFCELAKKRIDSVIFDSINDSEYIADSIESSSKEYLMELIKIVSTWSMYKDNKIKLSENINETFNELLLIFKEAENNDIIKKELLNSLETSVRSLLYDKKNNPSLPSKWDKKELLKIQGELF